MDLVNLNNLSYDVLRKVTGEVACHGNTPRIGACNGVIKIKNIQASGISLSHKRSKELWDKKCMNHMTEKLRIEYMEFTEIISTS